MSHSTGGQWLPVQQAAPEEGVAVGGTDLLTSLKQAKLKGQIVLKGMGVTDPLEQEFGEVVKPLMDSCTKEAIAVSCSVLSDVRVSLSSTEWEGMDIWTLQDE